MHLSSSLSGRKIGNHPITKEEDTKENADTVDGLSSASPTASLHSVDSMIRSWNISSIRGDKERKLIVQQLKKLQISEPVITLNIGGTRYSTSINTLLRDEGSFFYGMFCGKYNLRTSHDKSFFIDRDGTLFGYILNYLRTGHLILDFNDEILKRSLLLEAQFYRIQPLIHVLEPKVDSLILSEFHLKVLESWVSMEWLRSNRMNETVQTQQSAMVTVPKLKFVALYRASKHGFAASAFHRRCDHKKNTLTVIKANGTVFGGFTSIPWEATNDGRAVDQINPNTKSNNITFTYFLECHSDIWREKYNLIKSEKWDYCGSHQASYAKNPCYSVYHHKDCGPVFGYRPCFDYNGDLAAHILVGNDCDKNLNSRIDSFIGEHLSVRKHMTDSFFVSDYEVFQVSQI